MNREFIHCLGNMVPEWSFQALPHFLFCFPLIFNGFTKHLSTNDKNDSGWDYFILLHKQMHKCTWKKYVYMRLYNFSFNLWSNMFLFLWRCPFFTHVDSNHRLQHLTLSAHLSQISSHSQWNNHSFFSSCEHQAHKIFNLSLHLEQKA